MRSQETTLGSTYCLGLEKSSSVAVLVPRLAHGLPTVLITLMILLVKLQLEISAIQSNTKIFPFSCLTDVVYLKPTSGQDLPN